MIDSERAKLLESHVLREDGTFYPLFYHWSHFYRSQFQLLLLYQVEFWAGRQYPGTINGVEEDACARGVASRRTRASRATRRPSIRRVARILYGGFSTNG